MRGPSVACPHVRAEDESLSSHKRALGHVNAEGGGNHSICVAFLAHVPWGFFISIIFFFFRLSMFLAADVQKSWTNGCGKHTNWLHSERAGSTHGACRSSPRSASICAAHVCRG